MKMSLLTRATIALGAGALLATALPLSASAHVTVDPGQAEPGAYTVITLKVPNESETAGTTKVELTLPAGTPFASVRYVPVAGWTTELVRETLPKPVKMGESEITEAVTKVIWTAKPGAQIVAGELQLFPLSVGPVPDTGSIVLTADQTYDDGSVVSWNETAENAEHPAPVLYVNDAPVSDHHGGSGDHDADASEHGDSEHGGASSESSDGDVLARVLGLGGLVVGAVGIVLAITARRKATV
ncbi:MAG: YcnI family protein [Microbacteriaceae bacterium]